MPGRSQAPTESPSCSSGRTSTRGWASVASAAGPSSGSATSCRRPASGSTRSRPSCAGRHHKRRWRSVSRPWHHRRCSCSRRPSRERSSWRSTQRWLALPHRSPPTSGSRSSAAGAWPSARPRPSGATSRPSSAPASPTPSPHASAVARLLAAAIAAAPPRKGLVTDLDGTLWAGILGEDGPEAVAWDLDSGGQRHALYQQLLGALASTGTLVGVASRNDAGLAARALARGPTSWSTRPRCFRSRPAGGVSRSWSAACSTPGTCPPTRPCSSMTAPLDVAEAVDALPGLHGRRIPARRCLAAAVSDRAADPVRAPAGDPRRPVAPAERPWRERRPRSRRVAGRRAVRTVPRGARRHARVRSWRQRARPRRRAARQDQPVQPQRRAADTGIATALAGGARGRADHGRL